MKTLAIISLAFVLSAYSLASAAGSPGWKNLNGSLELPGIWASWNRSNQDSRARTNMAVELEDAFFTSGSFGLNSLQEDPVEFVGNFHWEGLFKGKPDNGRSGFMNVCRQGVGVSMRNDVSHDEGSLRLSGWASLFPADIVSNSFYYSEQNIYVGWDEDLQSPIYEPGWVVDYEFRGTWLPTATMTAEEVGAMFLVPEPATLGLLLIGSVLVRKRR